MGLSTGRESVSPSSSISQLHSRKPDFRRRIDVAGIPSVISAVFVGRSGDMDCTENGTWDKFWVPTPAIPIKYTIIF